MKPRIFMAIYQILNLIIFGWLFHSHFANKEGHIGNDYSYFLPQLMDGWFWFKTNGLLAVPWFSPGGCGGIPAFPNPQNLYYSLPQFLTFLFDPVTSVYLTALVFAWLGWLGTYLLLQRFGVHALMAALCGSLFMFNSLYLHRLLIGHLSFHAVMLMPLLAYCLLRRSISPTAGSVAAHSGAAALLAGYMFHAGMVHLLIPVALSILAVGLLHGIVTGRYRTFFLQSALAGLLALGLCAAKLTAAGAYLAQFPRDGYPLPGAQGFFNSLLLLFQSLFLNSHAAFSTADKVVVNSQWLIEIHEWEFSLTFLPLVLLLPGAVWFLVQGRYKSLNRSAWLALGGVALILLLPVGLNTYSPGWNALLKQLPLLKSSAQLFRWFLADMLPLIVLTGLALERVALRKRNRALVLGLGLPVLLLVHLAHNRTHYRENQIFPTEFLLKGYQQISQSGKIPPVTQITQFFKPDGQPLIPADRNVFPLLGQSYILCYEPLFGYTLEFFPREPLVPGPVTQEKAGYFNLKNPACYLYPQANGCRPGEHFKTSQRQALEAFTHYKPFPFAVPPRQTAANYLTLGTLALCLALMAVGWRKSPQPED